MRTTLVDAKTSCEHELSANACRSIPPILPEPDQRVSDEVKEGIAKAGVCHGNKICSTILRGPADIKAYLFNNRELLTGYLTTTLVEDGAGREPPVGDRRVICLQN